MPDKNLGNLLKLYNPWWGDPKGTVCANMGRAQQKGAASSAPTNYEFKII